MFTSDEREVFELAVLWMKDNSRTYQRFQEFDRSFFGKALFILLESDLNPNLSELSKHFKSISAEPDAICNHWFERFWIGYGEKHKNGAEGRK